MYFTGDPIKVIGFVDNDTITHIINKIKENFNDKWIRRTFKLMDTSYALKAITPSNFDRTNNETEKQLSEFLMPYVMPYVGENDVVVYLDISSLPPGARSLVHVDYAWIHQLSRRVRIPLVTNPQSVFALKTINGLYNYNLKVGKVYETNNQVLHLAANLGNTDRWHIVADIMDKDVYDYLVKTEKLDKWAIDPTVNFSFNQQVVSQLTEALRTDPINI
jgi:hypothetical protein